MKANGVKSMAVAALVLASAGALVAAKHREMDAEEVAVRAALQHYINGHATGLADEFKAGMHEQGTMYFVRDGKFTTRSFPDFFAGATGKPAADEAQRKRRIDFVDIVGTAAIAKLTLEYPDVTFTDYMELLKIDGKWQIVAKSFHRGPGTKG